MNDEEKSLIEKQLIQDYLGHPPAAFVEVGANDPRQGSQTYPLEQAGWTGILVEPQARHQAALKQFRPRSFIVQAACTSPANRGTVTLYLPTHLDGFATLEPNKDDVGIHYDQTETVPARTLDEIIDEWRQASGNTAKIRFLSIDVEGHEVDVLRGFSSAKHQPDLILVEDKLRDLSKHRLLRGMGYRLVRRTCLNNWYVPEDHGGPATTLWERVRLFRKVFLGLPFRMLRRWSERRRSRPPAAT